MDEVAIFGLNFFKYYPERLIERFKGINLEEEAPASCIATQKLGFRDDYDRFTAFLLRCPAKITVTLHTLDVAEKLKMATVKEIKEVLAAIAEP